MRLKGERVHGPYKHRNKWRIVLAGRGGTQEVVSFPLEEAARAHKAALLKQIAGRSVSEAVQEHVVDLRERGLRPSTVTRAEFHLRSFFQLDANEHGRTIPFARTGGILEDLTARRCEELYAALRKEVAVDTHRNALNVAKAFGAWCAERSWLRDNPLAGIKPVGQRNRGKPQLRLDEARRLVELCERKAK